MTGEIIQRDKNRFHKGLLLSLITLFFVIIFSLTIGQYVMTFSDSLMALMDVILQRHNSSTSTSVIGRIRLPRTIAAFIVGSCLSVSGGVYQSTFNNKLVSPDLLGVSAGACVGAAVAILLGVNSYLISVFAFCFGVVSVFAALCLPRLFRNRSNLMLVLSGIIVGSFMDAILGLIKYTADREEKLAEITFWIMGELKGMTLGKIGSVFPIYMISMIGILALRWRINIVSLGEDEAKSVGLNFKGCRLAIIVFSTLLTAISVSLCGNVGWIGLVVPHIVRAVFGADNRYSVPMSFLWGGTFMIIVDMISRNLSTSEIPLSIITGIIGTVIYAIVLIKKGSEIHE